MAKNLNELKFKREQILEQIEKKQQDISVLRKESAQQFVPFGNALLVMQFQLRKLEKKLAKLNKQIATIEKNEIEK